MAAALVFGVSGSAYGVVQSLTESESAEISDARDANGKVTDQKAYSKTSEASFEGLFNGTALGGAGTSMTIGSLTALCTSQSKTQSNTEWQRISATISKKDSATQTAYSA